MLARLKSCHRAKWVNPFEADTLVVYSFGTDCQIDNGFGATQCNDPKSLTTKKGWDNVTGVGNTKRKNLRRLFRAK